MYKTIKYKTVIDKIQVKLNFKFKLNMPIDPIDCKIISSLYKRLIKLITNNPTSIKCDFGQSNARIKYSRKDTPEITKEKLIDLNNKIILFANSCYVDLMYPGGIPGNILKTYNIPIPEINPLNPNTKPGDFPPCPFGTVTANDFNDGIDHSKESDNQCL